MKFDPGDVMIRMSGNLVIAYVKDDPTNEIVAGNAHSGVSLQDILDDAEQLLG